MHRNIRKGVLKKIKETKLKKGEKIAVYQNKSMVLRWKYKKDVIVLSTLHDDFMKKVMTRRGKDVVKPKAVLDYNSQIHNLSNNLLCQFSAARNRLKKYFKKVFRHVRYVSTKFLYSLLQGPWW